MNDLISRQAVLRLLSTIPPEEATTKALLIQSVKQMDDVQPEVAKDTNVLTNDCISRQAAIDALRTHERKASNKWFDNQLDIEWNNAIDICCYDIDDLPSVQPEIIYCKDCVKHNKGHGYYLDGTFIGIKDCCPLVEIRGMAHGHEFDYQYCAYAERRTDD